ncbi:MULTISPECIES: GNAT family N-acetyltransferase [Microbulbifer]|uniref:GNAT family N-acetyltransferase n=1 Tax=Microbulbifer TaxID=48073 RepID=UPI001F21AEF8|nr:GNAT family N-acetyltransferase [Microbulbifer zhoushanensis]
MDNSLRLVEPVPQQLEELMSWVTDADSCRLWGGPWFRFPFDAISFREDCRWDEAGGRVLAGPDGGMLAFGRYYLREQRCHLGHLIVSPAERGRGLGSALVQRLCAEGCRQLRAAECSLFVLKDNARARSVYQRLGFRLASYPGKAEWLELCDYLVAPGDIIAAASPLDLQDHG